MDPTELYYRYIFWCVQLEFAKSRNWGGRAFINSGDYQSRSLLDRFDEWCHPHHNAHTRSEGYRRRQGAWSPHITASPWGKSCSVDAGHPYHLLGTHLHALLETFLDHERSGHSARTLCGMEMHFVPWEHGGSKDMAIVVRMDRTAVAHATPDLNFTRGGLAGRSLWRICTS
ncbi:hypothetical protein QC760_001827 [Botrytis cinerea]